MSTSSAQDPVVIPDGIAGPLEAGQNPGFTVISAQAPDLTEIGNSLSRAIQQLNGTLVADGELVEDEAEKGANPDGSFDVDVINFLDVVIDDPEVEPVVTNFDDDVEFPGIPGNWLELLGIVLNCWELFGN